MNSRRLKAELFEIQMILYLILAQMVETDWIMWALRFWALVTFGTVLYHQAKSRDEKKTDDK